MPWILTFPRRTPAEIERLQQSLSLFRTSPDVDSIIELRQDPADPNFNVYIVRFDDELEQTNDPELLRIPDDLRRAEEAARQTTDPGFQDTVRVTGTIESAVIQQYLASSEGRQQLAQSMIAPLRRRLDYQGIARQVFAVEQLPAGALPYYSAAPSEPPLPDGVHPIRDVFDAMQGRERSGIGARIVEVLPGRARVEGLFSITDVFIGGVLEITTSGYPSNNGRYLIITVVSPTSVWIDNPSAIIDYYADSNWSVVARQVVDTAPNFFDVSLVSDPLDPLTRLGNRILSPIGPGDLTRVVMTCEGERTGWSFIVDDSFLPDE